MPLILISNPVSGNKSGHVFVQQHVLPILAEHGVQVDELVVTNAPNHAGHAVLSFILKHQKQGLDNISVILSSGDGTLHEMINALLASHLADAPVMPLTHVSIALIPNGTANALYSSLFPKFEDTVSYKLQAVRALISSSGHSKPLTIAVTAIETSDRTTQSIYSAIVTSTSLHASILHDSEALREDVPDIERFKIAAKNNITRWYRSTVQLLPSADGTVCMYNPQTQTFEEMQPAIADGVFLKGPFAYFTSTVNVDRLEPLFMISALQSKIPSATASMEIVALRPCRSPTIQGDSSEDHERFAGITTAVLTAAYKGTHADLTFNDIGDANNSGAIAEYIRCGGWKWTPDDEDEFAHLLCADGSTFHIERGGRAICKLHSGGGFEFRVYQS